MNLIDVTGKDENVPECPKHKGIALIPETRPKIGGEGIQGYWRCPEDNKVYIQEPPWSPTY